MAHTKGPWTARKTGYTGRASGAYYIYGNGSDGRSPCVAHVKRSTIQPMEDNARLIAAAPDLLDAIREMLAAMDNSVDARTVDDVAAMFRYVAAEDACRALIARFAEVQS